MAEDTRLKSALEAFQRGDLDRALADATEALESAPTPQWHYLLGLIHCRLGDPATGVDHLRIAADGAPANTGMQVMLARALIDAGRSDEVLAMPEPPAIRSAGDVARWQARAEAADAAGNGEAAVAAWSRITAAAPRDWRAWGNFATALKGQNRLPESAGAFVTAARLNPADLRIRDDAVAALLDAARYHENFLQFDEAEQALRQAHELDPANVSVVSHLGIALERTNRLEEAAKLVDDARAAGIDGSLGYVRALLAWREGRIEEARDLLATVDAAREPRALALRVKVLDALDDPPAAFEAAIAMNQAEIDRTVNPEKREEWTRLTKDYRKEQHRLARTITPDWAAKLPTLSDRPKERLSFLVGFPRSGTTLLDTFLLGHPDVAVLEEKQLVGAARQVTGAIEDLPGVTTAQLEAARQAYLDRLAEHIDPAFGGVIVDKFPLDMGAAPLIHAIFPGAPIIFMQRHPCDVVLSGFLQHFGTVNFSDISAAADYYDAMMSIWAASTEVLPLNVHTVVYEELVRDPEAVLKPVVSFLGLEWDERIVDHQRTARERGTIVTPSYDQVIAPVSTKPSGRWKRYEKQLEPVLPILMPWAQRLGYTE